MRQQILLSPILIRKAGDKRLLKLINKILRGWINYYKLAETRRFAEILDGGIRRGRPLILWSQWKRRGQRFIQLRRAGLSEDRSRQSAFNGRGGWFNSGASHMNPINSLANKKTS